MNCCYEPVKLYDEFVLEKLVHIIAYQNHRVSFFFSKKHISNFKQNFPYVKNRCSVLGEARHKYLEFTDKFELKFLPGT